jgi:hypothetical protein
MVVGRAIQQGDKSSGNTGYRSTETIVNPHLQTTDVEIIKVGIERCITLPLDHAIEIIHLVRVDVHTETV